MQAVNVFKKLHKRPAGSITLQANTGTCHRGGIHRRLLDRLGSPLREQRTEGPMVPHGFKVTYKPVGTTSNLDTSSTNDGTGRVPCQGPLRQHNCGTGHSTGGLSVQAAERDIPSDSDGNSQEKYHTVCGISQRLPKHQSRPVIETETCVNGMDPRSGVEAGHTDLDTSSTDRPVCNSREQGPSRLRLTILPSTGDGDGRLCLGLGSVGHDLSVSTDESDFEGFTQDQVLRRDSIRRGSLVAEPPVVQRTAVGVQGPSAPVAGPVPNGGRSEGTGTITSERPPARLDFIKSKLTLDGLDDRVASFFIGCIRKSTRAQYERVWKLFCSYCRTFNIFAINDNSVLGFFNHLLEDKHLKVSTLIAYRSALINPLYYGFGYNMNNNFLNKLLKGIALTHPSQPIRVPDWSLNKVLNYLLTVGDNNNSIYYNAQKSIFLLSLALGSRISELFALKRGNNFL